MPNARVTSRRRFLGWSAALIGTAAFAACAPAAPPTNTAAPAKPTEAPKPTSAPAATTAPAAGAASPAAAAATGASAAATKPAAAATGAASPAAAATTSAAPAAASPAAKPSAGGTITIYSALNESTNKAFTEAFTAKTGVKTEVLPLAAAGELQTRIQTEKNAPKADVFIGGSSEFHDPLGKQNLLEPYKSPNAEAVDKDFKDPDGRWTGWYIGIFGNVVNKDRWAKEMAGKDKPKTWDDLLAPELKGKVAFPDPVKTGGGYIFLANQVFRFGKDEAKAMDFMKKLDANVAQYVGTSPLAIELVGQGQFVVAPNWGHDILTAANQGKPVEFAAPENTAFEIGGMSIVKGAPNLTGAKAFIDWVLTKEAAELNVKLSNRLSVLKDVAPAPGAPTLDKVKLVQYDRQWATDNKDRLLKAWTQATGH